MALFEDYIRYSDFHISNVLHATSVKAMVGEVYMQLRSGHTIDSGSAALILSICASSAYFWDWDFPAHFRFLSEDNAAAQSLAWRGAAWDLLDQGQRAAKHSLDAIQARMILADVVYNLEGATSRFRYLHSCARAAAYEVKLHLIDMPGRDSEDNELQREIKRRVWWYLAGTDWSVVAVPLSPVRHKLRRHGTWLSIYEPRLMHCLQASLHHGRRHW